MEGKVELLNIKNLLDSENWVILLHIQHLIRIRGIANKKRMWLDENLKFDNMTKFSDEIIPSKSRVCTHPTRREDRRGWKLGVICLIKCWFISLMQQHGWSETKRVCKDNQRKFDFQIQLKSRALLMLWFWKLETRYGKVDLSKTKNLIMRQENVKILIEYSVNK